MKSKRKPNRRPLRGLTVEWLAKRCGLDVGFMWKLARDTAALYNPTREQPKKNGGCRPIDPPKRWAKPIFRKITKVLAEEVGVHETWHGGAKGKSAFTSAGTHTGKRYLAVRDVKNCYPSTTPTMLFNAFTRLGASEDFAKFLSRVSTVHDRVPQGGPLSNLVINLFFLRQDRHLQSLARRRHGSYGRLTDDFVASANCYDSARRLGQALETAIEARGLNFTNPKRAASGLLAPHNSKVLHSLRINSRRGVRPSREHVKKATDLAQSYARSCNCAAPDDVERLSQKRGRLSGWVNYFAQAHKSPARQLRWMRDLADRHVLQMLHHHGLYPRKDKWWLKREVNRLLLALRSRRSARLAG